MARLWCLIAGVLFAAALAGQEAANTAGIPALQGVYYRAAEDWVALPYTVLSPYPRSVWKWWLGTGRREYAAEVPGGHAAVATGAQPVFVIRGLPSRLTPIVVRLEEKPEFRWIRMPMARMHEPRTPFEEKSRVAIESYVVGEKMVAVRPVEPLAPGEYAVLASPNGNATMLFFSYDFRVVR